MFGTARSASESEAIDQWLILHTTVRHSLRRL